MEIFNRSIRAKKHEHLGAKANEKKKLEANKMPLGTYFPPFKIYDIEHEKILFFYTVKQIFSHN
jgi:hypothetical protein